MKIYLRFCPILSFLIMLFSCAGIPQANDEAPGTIVARILSVDELKDEYGPSFHENPFLPYHGLIFGKKEEFYAVQITTSNSSAELSLVRASFNANVAEQPRIMFREDLMDYWVNRAVETDNPNLRQKLETRESTILDTTMPKNGKMSIGHRRSALILFSGPLPRIGSYTVQLQLLVNDEPQEFELVFP